MIHATKNCDISLKKWYTKIGQIFPWDMHYSDVIISTMTYQITSITDCLLNRLFRRRSKKTSKLRVNGLCEGNSPVTDEFSAQRASNVENVFIWWRHHANKMWRELEITGRYVQREGREDHAYVY